MAKTMFEFLIQHMLAQSYVTLKIDLFAKHYVLYCSHPKKQYFQTLLGAYLLKSVS